MSAAFVLCEAALVQFPILQGSNGFRKLCGLAEGDHSMTMETSKSRIAQEARLHGIGHDKVEAALKVMLDVATDALASPKDRPVLLIGQRSTGELFTCEMSFEQKTHPELGWPYMIGVPHASEITVLDALEAACKGPAELKELCYGSTTPMALACKKDPEVQTLASVSTAASLGTGSLSSPCFHLGAIAQAECEEPAAMWCQALEELDFELVLLDPAHVQLPIVLCSRGFRESHGDWHMRPFQQFFRDARPTAIFQATALHDFWESARMGEFQETAAASAWDLIPHGEMTIHAELPRGGICAVHLKQVELDDKMVVVGVSAEHEGNLDQHLDQAIQAMAAEFFYSAPMRRQTAVF